MTCLPKVAYPNFLRKVSDTIRKNSSPLFVNWWHITTLLGFSCFLIKMRPTCIQPSMNPKFLYSHEHLAVKLSLQKFKHMFTTTLFSCFLDHPLMKWWILNLTLLFACHCSRTNRKVIPGFQRDLRKLKCEKVALSLTKPRRHPPTETPEPEL